MSRDEAAIENEIQAKGLNAPRLNPAHIDNMIAEELYFTAADGVIAKGANVAHNSPARLLTFCVLILRNGFTVTGESACASPENFDEEIGRKVAREKAREKIWALEGYLLRQQLYLQERDGSANRSASGTCREPAPSSGDAQSPA
jgi:hypothetical protein